MIPETIEASLSPPKISIAAIVSVVAIIKPGVAGIANFSVSFLTWK